MGEGPGESNVISPETLETARKRAQQQNASKTEDAESPARSAFIAKLYHDHWNDLCRRLNRLYGAGPPEPEDIAQEAFARLSRLKRIDHIENPKAFLFKVAINVALKSIGRIARTRAFLADQLNNPDIELEEISPERILGDKERIVAVERSVKKLTQKQREILVRSRLKGQTYAEISAATGWSQADISRQLRAALAVLEAADNEASAKSAPRRQA